jgi:siroheme synthase-like protein
MNTITVKENLVKAEEGNNLFPIFLKLEQFRLLIVGGGKVGLEKLQAVTRNSPATKILLVATEIGPAIKELAVQYSTVLLAERPFASSDLDGADIVITAVNDRALSKMIYTEAKQKNKLVNVADTPELCDFYLSSIVKKGNLKLAISTNGKSPTIAKRLKELLSEVLPDELDEVLNNLHILRNKLKGNFEDKVQQLNELTKILVEVNEEEK